MTQKELERKFNDTWTLWTAEFSTKEYQSMYASNEIIEYQIGEVLQELLMKYDSILLPELTKIVLSKEGKRCLHITIVPKKHLSLCKSNIQPATSNTGASIVHKFSTFIGFTKDNSRKEEDQIIKRAQKASDDFFIAAKDSFRKVRKNFHKSYAFDLLKEFIDTITNYKKTKQLFTSEYIVDMALKYAS